MPGNCQRVIQVAGAVWATRYVNAYAKVRGRPPVALY